MYARYLGLLPWHDPLQEVLRSRIFTGVHDPVFHVEAISDCHQVYRYHEERSRLSVVGKFVRPDEPDTDKRARILGEYGNLVSLREMGFANRPHRVVRPLGQEVSMGLAVVEEDVRGRDLDHFLLLAAGGETEPLRRALHGLAAFLASLHGTCATGRQADLGHLSWYTDRLLDKLRRQTVLDAGAAREIWRLRDRWLGRSRMRAGETIVHGDATPTNFLFGEGGDVVAIDLERMKRADPAWDIGMVCGELKHAFLWRTGVGASAEPFIRAFLDRYAAAFPDPAGTFRAITRRLPFFMALTELRIARNGWLSWQHRLRLVREAHACLDWGLR
jgi:aminoglycoside phosphotransferase (APT) family kinase protein